MLSLKIDTALFEHKSHLSNQVAHLVSGGTIQQQPSLISLSGVGYMDQIAS